MESKDKAELKKPYVYVKDENGVVHICKRDELIDPENLTEEEYNTCMIPPGDA